MNVSLNEVNQQQEKIKVAVEEIDKIQKKCKHSRILHKLLCDQYNRQGHSQSCADCGKDLGCSSAMPLDGIQSKTWVEEK
jgi:hypothetical protein